VGGQNGPMKSWTKILAETLTPLLLGRYRLGQCPRVAAEEKRIIDLEKNEILISNIYLEHVTVTYCHQSL
jgi:hypothetical protein